MRLRPATCSGATGGGVRAAQEGYLVEAAFSSVVTWGLIVSQSPSEDPRESPCSLPARDAQKVPGREQQVCGGPSAQGGGQGGGRCAEATGAGRCLLEGRGQARHEEGAAQGGEGEAAPGTAGAQEGDAAAAGGGGLQAQGRQGAPARRARQGHPRADRGDAAPRPGAQGRARAGGESQEPPGGAPGREPQPPCVRRGQPGGAHRRGCHRCAQCGGGGGPAPRAPHAGGLHGLRGGAAAAAEAGEPQHAAVAAEAAAEEGVAAIARQPPQPALHGLQRAQVSPGTSRGRPAPPCPASPRVATSRMPSGASRPGRALSAWCRDPGDPGGLPGSGLQPGGPAPPSDPPVCVQSGGAGYPGPK